MQRWRVGSASATRSSRDLVSSRVGRRPGRTYPCDTPLVAPRRLGRTSWDVSPRRAPREGVNSLRPLCHYYAHYAHYAYCYAYYYAYAYTYYAYYVYYHACYYACYYAYYYAYYNAYD